MRVHCTYRVHFLTLLGRKWTAVKYVAVAAAAAATTAAETLTITNSPARTTTAYQLPMKVCYEIRECAWVRLCVCGDSR